MSSVATIGIIHHIFRFQRKTRNSPSTPAFAPKLCNDFFINSSGITAHRSCQRGRGFRATAHTLFAASFSKRTETERGKIPSLLPDQEVFHQEHIQPAVAEGP